MKIKFITVLFCLYFCTTSSVWAEDSLQSQEEWLQQQMAPRAFLILASTHDYKTALKIAKQAEKKLTLPLDLRDLKPHKPQGTDEPILTLPAKICEEDFGFPCYYPRGRDSDSVYYISIEMTDAYEGLAEGYYFVVAALTEKRDTKMDNLLKTAKLHFADAYIKTGKVYMGCMH